jgi:diguanylate cyclase (GGDEF)-like protein
MREEVKIQLLQNLLTIVTEKYDYFTSYQKSLIEENFQKAIKDNLTGLYNRAYLEDIGEKLLAEAKREDLVVAVVFIDLNNFKSVNDIYGHDNGDKVLKEVAEELKKSFRSYDIIVRYSGDEFIVMLKMSKNSKNCDIKNLLDLIDNRIKERLKKYNVSISYGIATTDESFDLNKLIELADIRMYEDKKRKKANR